MPERLRLVRGKAPDRQFDVSFNQALGPAKILESERGHPETFYGNIPRIFENS
jgi:hypothetical protein